MSARRPHDQVRQKARTRHLSLYRDVLDVIEPAVQNRALYLERVSLGSLAYISGDYDIARALLRRARDGLVAVDDRSGVAVCLKNLG